MTDQNQFSLSLGPQLIEKSHLPLVSQSKIIVDLGTLTHVNSMGIKKWCEWLSAHQKVKQIWLIHVPYVFGRHLSVVKGMVEKNVWIRSIYVPFYSEKLKIREDSLFVHGVHYDDSRIIMMPEILDSEKNFMEIDIRVDTYFMFLKHLKELRQEE